MARKKTTVYIEEELLREAKVTAARSGKREYEVFEEALRRHLGFADVVERIWSKLPAEDTASEEEAERIAAEEVAAVRRARRRRGGAVTGGAGQKAKRVRSGSLGKVQPVKGGRVGDRSKSRKAS